MLDAWFLCGIFRLDYALSVVLCMSHYHFDVLHINKNCWIYLINVHILCARECNLDTYPFHSRTFPLTYSQTEMFLAVCHFSRFLAHRPVAVLSSTRCDTATSAPIKPDKWKHCNNRKCNIIIEFRIWKIYSRLHRICCCNCYVRMYL